MHCQNPRLSQTLQNLKTFLDDWKEKLFLFFKIQIQFEIWIQWRQIDVANLKDSSPIID